MLRASDERAKEETSIFADFEITWEKGGGEGGGAFVRSREISNYRYDFLQSEEGEGILVNKFCWPCKGLTTMVDDVLCRIVQSPNL